MHYNLLLYLEATLIFIFYEAEKFIKSRSKLHERLKG